KAALNGLVVVNGNNPADDANNNGNDNAGTTAPVGDGSAPTQTGDAGSLALVGLIALAGAAAVLTRKKRN
ncbi:MAG: NPXTG-anchored protein, partial [Clostridiales bacterium]|nr:NPXTG-anchored protein [Clostridiales bacterium]